MRKIFGIAAIALALGGVFAWLGRQTVTRIIPASALRFSSIHSMAWDPATHLLRSTKDDPYGFIELPAASLPLHEITVEFVGAPPATRSNFYVYQYPAHLPGVFLNDSYATVGTREILSDGFRIRWILDNSKVARLDLPDDVDLTVEIRQISLVSGRFGTWTTNLMWLSLAVGILLPVWRVLQPLLARGPRYEIAFAVLLVALKMTFAGDLRLTVIGNAAHDDALFVGQADALMQGHWLGDFNDRTLSKGPVFPLFLATVGLAHLKLQTVQLAVHALACLVLVLACRPLVPRVGARVLLLIALLYDPHSYSSETIGRVLRSGLHPALVLLVLAGLIGLAARSSRPARQLLPWALLLGAAWTAFWFCREEGLWLVPSAVLIFAVAAWSVGRRKDLPRRARLGLLALPCLMFAVGDVALRAVNYHFYHAAVTVDVSDGPFPKAYGALVRLKPAREIQGIPVPHDVQLAAYAVSPAFAELRPYLEGDVGQGWIKLSLLANGAKAAPDEIGGGWYQWALRDAAAHAGHYRDAATAAAYWRRVAREINAAADQGRIPAGPPRSGFLPRIDRSLLPALWTSFGEAYQVVAEFAHFSTQFLSIENSSAQVAQFVRVTHEFDHMHWTPPTRITETRIALSQIYATLSRPVTVAALASTFLLAVLVIRRRQRVLPLAVVLALVGGATALMLVISLVDSTSFIATIGTYLAPATPLVLAWWVLAPAWVWDALRPAPDTPRS